MCRHLWLVSLIELMMSLCYRICCILLTEPPGVLLVWIFDQRNLKFCWLDVRNVLSRHNMICIGIRLDNFCLVLVFVCKP